MAQMPGEGLDFRRGGSVPRVGDKELGAFQFEANVERPERARVRSSSGTMKAGTSAIPKPARAASRMNIPLLILRPAIGRTTRAPAGLSNRQSVSRCPYRIAR
jgi:hypothetical protein